MVNKLSLSIATLFGSLLLSACTDNAQIEEPTSSSEISTTQTNRIDKPSFGDTQAIGDLEYTFIGSFAQGDIGSGDYIITGEKHMYGIMLTIKNIGEQPVTIDPSYFKIISSQKTFFVDETATLYKNEYEIEDEASISYQIRELYAPGVPTGRILTSLEPNEERNGYLIFGVNSDTFIVEKNEPQIVEKLEIKSNKSSSDTIFFYFS